MIARSGTCSQPGIFGGFNTTPSNADADAEQVGAGRQRGPHLRHTGGDLIDHRAGAFVGGGAHAQLVVQPALLVGQRGAQLGTTQIDANDIAHGCVLVIIGCWSL
jgi:hypothetical protein